QVVAEMAVDYLRICCVFSFGICLFGTFEKFLQSSGLALYSTIAQIAGALTNIVLDPILIYGLAGAPALGVKGAAIATVAGQMVSCTVAVIFHLKLNKDVTNHIRYMKPHPLIIQQIFRIGLPAMIAQGLVSLTAYLLNIIFITIDETVVTVYGLYYKIQQFVLLISFGLRDASTPIIATAFGLQDKQRIRDGIKYSLIIATVIMVGGTLLFEVFASPIAAAFGLSGSAQSLCIEAIRIISISLVFAGINIAVQGAMQSLNAGLNSLIISICRQFIFVIPVAYGLTQLVIHGNMDTSLVWYTFLIGEGITCAISVILLKQTNKKVVNPLHHT
ncbi:MAG: MATE family efflux transporter, partial [Eubacteriales bacterium]